MYTNSLIQTRLSYYKRDEKSNIGQRWKHMNSTKTKIMALLLFSILVTIAVSIGVSAEETYSGQIDGALSFNDTRSTNSADNITAVGGNISQMNLSITIQSMYWAGVFGNVSHSLALAGNSNTFYSWQSSIGSTGAVLFSNSSNVDWDSITVGTNTTRENEDALLTLTGNVDSVNSTFGYQNNINSLNISGTVIPASSAPAINTSSNGGTNWETILLHDGANPVYAGVINQSSNENYDGVVSDFQVMVPVDGATNTRTYFLYAAIQ